MKQKWLVLQEYGWQIVIPNRDIKPHSSNQKPPKNKIEERELAWLDCPCKPKIDYLNKLIVHNSFEHIEQIEESIKKYVIII